MQLVKCNLCKSKNFTLLFEGHDYLSFSPLTFKVVKCDRCGLVYLNPRPLNLICYYDAYRKQTLEEKDVFLFLLPNRVKKIKRFKTSGRIFDVGCGIGVFLSDMRKEGFDVYGCETYPYACDLAKKEGLRNIYNDDILSLNLPENFFDVVTLWHVLEHLEEPRKTLKKIRQILKDDGMLVIECPDFSSLQSRFFKDKWLAVDLPRHLYHFSLNTLRKVLRSAGFEIYKMDYIINIRISFINLKRSLLRWLRLEQTPKGDEQGNLTNLPLRKGKLIWRLLRFVLNTTCFGLSLFLNLINSKDMFRVYCKKIEGL